MTATENPDEIYRAKMNLENSKIAWKELQRFFASGSALAVAADLDLVEVAYQMSEDNVVQIQQWATQGKLGKVSDEQAGEWLSSDVTVWAVVVSPWVLVQPIRQVH